jgi:hypothetical protein
MSENENESKLAKLNIIRDYHNQIKLKLYSSAIYDYLSHFWINEIKSDSKSEKEWSTININYQNSLTMIDLCTGRGGDIWKWEKFNSFINKIYAFDINCDFINEANLRLMKSKCEDFKTKINFFSNIDLTNDNSFDKMNNLISLSKSKSEEISLVSMQMAIHYFFGSEIIFNRLMKWIHSQLRTGGVFIGTFINGERVLECFRNYFKSSDLSQYYQNDSNNDNHLKFQYNFPEKLGFMQMSKNDLLFNNNYNKFGIQLKMQISGSIIDKESNEFLVMPKFLISNLETIGFKLLSLRNFIDDDDKHKNNNKDIFSKLHNSFIFMKL